MNKNIVIEKLFYISMYWRNDRGFLLEKVVKIYNRCIWFFRLFINWFWFLNRYRIVFDWSCLYYWWFRFFNYGRSVVFNRNLVSVFFFFCFCGVFIIENFLCCCFVFGNWFGSDFFYNFWCWSWSRLFYNWV